MKVPYLSLRVHCKPPGSKIREKNYLNNLILISKIEEFYTFVHLELLNK